MLLRVTLSAQSKGCLEGGDEETHGHGRLKQEDTCLGSVSAAHCTVWVWREAPGLLPLHREGVAGLQTWVLPVSAHGEGSLLGLLFQQFGESTPFGSQQDNEKPRGGGKGLLLWHSACNSGCMGGLGTSLFSLSVLLGLCPSVPLSVETAPPWASTIQVSCSRST